RLPCELHDLPFPVRDPLAEIVARQRPGLEHLAGLELHLADTRTAVETGALVEHAVAEDEPLRERLAVVRIRADDLVTVGRRGTPGSLRREKANRHDEEREPRFHFASIGHKCDTHESWPPWGSRQAPRPPPSSCRRRRRHDLP